MAGIPQAGAERRTRRPAADPLTDGLDTPELRDLMNVIAARQRADDRLEGMRVGFDVGRLLAVAGLLCELKDAGIRLRRRDGKVWASPASALTPAFADRIRHYKDVLLDLLGRVET